MKNITVYTPNQRLEMGFFRSFLFMFHNIIRSREFIYQLFKRDFFAAYKRSFIGIAWLFISPIVGIVSWIFMSRAGILNTGDVGIPYPAYVLVGSTMWGLFMSFYQSGASTIDAGREFILQVNYPHETLLIKQTAQVLANFLITLFLNLIVLIAFGIIPSWKTILLPVVVLPMFFLGAAIGLVMSVIAVVTIDLSKAVTMALGFLMYFTPIIYSPKFDNPMVRIVNKWNPLTYLVCAARDIIIYGRIDNFKGFLIAAALALVVFLLSWRLFFLSQYKVAEKI